MKATRTLPENYSFDSKFDLKNKRTLIWLNIGGLILTVGFLFLFGAITRWLRPDVGDGVLFSFDGTADALLKLAGILLIILLVMVLHEAVHGIFFWLFSRNKPVFGFKSGYAYAAMPDWYFPRSQYMIIGMAPFILLDGFGVVLLAVVPVNALWMVLVALLMNSSGAVADLAVVTWLLAKPATTIALDKADTIELYVPA